jgi:putative DNA methylase
MPYRKKLIEVALPLEAINKESAREKSIRHGHPSTLHLWWARRPLAACRAVLFAQLVDDPSEYMPDEKSADEERQRLFDLIEELVKWENINNEEVPDKARLEIARSVARDLGEPAPVGKEAIREFLATKAPPVLDPFAGGGSIPLEAQRLGLRAYASDLNPVAVLINKALIEIPPKFSGLPPVHPALTPAPSPKSGRGEKQAELWAREWKGAEGLAEDVRYYGKWMRDEAEKRIGHLYPKYKITQELLAERPDLKAQGLKPGDELTVIAWLWARTVKCPNPACGAQMPLARSFVLSTRKGKQAWVEPVVVPPSPTPPPQGAGVRAIRFVVKTGSGSPPQPPKIGRGAQFRCLACGQIAPEESIRAEFKAKRSGAQLMAIVAEGASGRVYLPPDEAHVRIALSAKPAWMPEEEMNTETPNLVSGRGYGITHWHELFTPRQLTALTTFSDLVGEARARALQDARSRHDRDPQAYADAVATYLGFSVDKGSNYWSTICAWHTGLEIMISTFSRQAIPMVWDFTEANPFSTSSGNFQLGIEQAFEMINNCPAGIEGIVTQADATKLMFPLKLIVSTDPPYYDNIIYSDLSDFFYIWLRRSIGKIYPRLFATMLVPKESELVASPYRFEGDKQRAEKYFEVGLRRVFTNFGNFEHYSFPTTLYYAFKQSEDADIDALISENSFTGWETMLTGLIDSGFLISGTWPMRTELVTNLKAGINALATSVVLVCRPRAADAPTATRRDFLAALKRELPAALRQLQLGYIAPVDFAQAAIGPGMAVFSRYKQVLEADGSPMRVRTALALINQELDVFLAEQEGEYDADTRWALAWYEQYGFNEGPFGVAETLSKAKNTSVGGLGEAGILLARAGKVRLLSRTELKEDWDPSQDKRPTAWEAVQYLIRALDTHGERGAALLLSRLGGLGETARDLAYRLYTICERKGWAQDALGYNMLVVAWPRLKEMARSTRPPEQGRLLE